MLIVRTIQTDANGPVLDVNGDEIELTRVEVPDAVQADGAQAIDDYVTAALAAPEE